MTPFVAPKVASTKALERRFTDFHKAVHDLSVT